MRWTTSAGVDGRLRFSFPAERASAVAAATVSGVAVYVTATGSHYDGDCARPGQHNCYATALRVFAAETGELLRTVDGAGGRRLVTAVVDGKPVAVTGDDDEEVQLVDLETGQVTALAGHTSPAQGLAIATLPDGPAAVSVSWDRTLRVFDLATGSSRVYDTGERLVAVAVASLDGRPVAVVAGSTVGIWDLHTGDRIGELPHARNVLNIAVWPEDNAPIVTLSTSCAVETWDPATGERAGASATVRWLSPDIAATHSGDGRRLVAVSEPESILLWDPHQGEYAGRPLVGPTWWCAVAPVKAGVVVTASERDARVAVWDIDGDPGRPGSGHSSTITGVTVGPDRRVIAGGTDGSIGAWSLDDATRDTFTARVPAPVRSIASVPVNDRTVVLVGGGELYRESDDYLHRWTGGGPDEPVLVNHRGEVDILTTAVVAGRPVAITAGCDNTTQVVDLATGAATVRLDGPASQTSGIAVGILDGRTVAAISYLFRPTQWWDLATGTSVNDPVNDTIEFGEKAHAIIEIDGQPILVTLHRDALRIRNLHTAQTWDLDSDHLEPITAVAIRQRGPLAAIARLDGSIAVADLATRLPVDNYILPYPARALAWTHDQDLIIACRRDLIRVSL